MPFVRQFPDEKRQKLFENSDGRGDVPGFGVGAGSVEVRWRVTVHIGGAKVGPGLINESMCNKCCQGADWR
jgi:hypothetical protein